MRNLGLDILRIVAVLLVIGSHLRFGHERSWFLHTWREGGWIGVDLFFVLSGYLVSGLLFREHKKHQSINIRHFLVRRGFKIYPGFWVLIAFTAYLQFREGNPVSLSQLASELLFVQNYFMGFCPNMWTLAVEEHFYIGIALLLGMALRYRKSRSFDFIPAAFAVVASLCLALRVLNYWVKPEYDWTDYLFPTHLRVDSLFFGVLLSYLAHYTDFERKLRRVPALFFVALGVALMSPAFIYPMKEHAWILIFGVNLFYLGAGSLLIAAVRLESSRNRLLLLLGALGATSYSIYLWHHHVGNWFFAVFRTVTGLKASLAFYLCFYILGSLAIGYAMSHLIEWPMLRLRDRLFPSKARALPVEHQPDFSPEPEPAPVPVVELDRAT